MIILETEEELVFNAILEHVPAIKFNINKEIIYVNELFADTLDYGKKFKPNLF